MFYIFDNKGFGLVSISSLVNEMSPQYKKLFTDPSFTKWSTISLLAEPGRAVLLVKIWLCLSSLWIVFFQEVLSLKYTLLKLDFWCGNYKGESRNGFSNIKMFKIILFLFANVLICTYNSECFVSRSLFL